MSKTIKFNLICDGKPIRTIENLKNNFCVEDILHYYKSKLLHRWLDVRGFTREYQEVNAITTDDSLEIVKELIRIFGIETDEKKIEENVYALQYLDEQRARYEVYEKESYHVTTIVTDYITGYSKLVGRICANPNDIAIVKASIAEIMRQYYWIFVLNYRELFWHLQRISVLAIMCLLANERARRFYLPQEDREIAIEQSDAENENSSLHDALSLLENWQFTSSEVETDTQSPTRKYAGSSNNRIQRGIYGRICQIVHAADFKEEMGENLMVYSGETEGYWKDLEAKGTRYMVIDMGNGDFVRAAGQMGGDLSSEDVRDKFVIIDGIDYKSNYDTHELLYMEV